MKPEKRPSIATVPADTLGQPRRVVTGGVRWAGTFAAFQHRNYRLFFSGQIISLVGTWIQTVAEGWLVYQLTNSAFLLGLIRFLNNIPVTLLTVVGGALADRRSKRNILIGTQILSMVLALTLAGLVYWKVVAVWHVAALGLLLGVANAFDIPARQSFVVEMVGKDNLMNAIALNSSMFNGARIAGPALAGLLIGFVGLAGCFFVNGLSYLAVIGGYLMMRVAPPPPPTRSPSLWRDTLEAIRFVRGNRVVKRIMIMVAVLSLFGWPYTVLMPVFARDILHVGAAGLGYLMAANGAGAFVGALTLASLGDHPHKRRLFYGGVLGFSATITGFALATTFWLAAVMLAGAGWSLIVSFATANTAVQLRVPDELRGRVMSLYSLAFIGFSPAGSLIAGAMARRFGAPTAVWTGAAICAVGALALMVQQSTPSES